jgi:biotin transport system substrate-specific component
MTDALWRSDSLIRKAVLVLGGSWLVAIAAQISVPMIPVPMTLQTLAILFVGYALGARLGAAALVAYLAQGAAGLPVFANGLNGVAFFGPTAGFLIGFVGMAWLAGLAADKGIARGFVGTALSAVVISALLYIPGFIWPMAVAGGFGIEAGWVAKDLTWMWTWFMKPFLIGDAVKAVLAALLVSGAWAALRKRA